jgi:hypothetical protein
VLAGLGPLPGEVQWPPEAALEAFVEDAEHRGDWREVEPLLQAAYDRNLAFLRAMEEAAREEGGPGQGAPAKTVDLGRSFGFGGWNETVAPLLEAKLRLRKYAEADELFQALFARVPRKSIAKNAADLARACGAEGLADKWGRLAR